LITADIEIQFENPRIKGGKNLKNRQRKLNKDVDRKIKKRGC